MPLLRAVQSSLLRAIAVTNSFLIMFFSFGFSPLVSMSYITVKTIAALAASCAPFRRFGFLFTLAY
jgi:hypothetical protein